MIILKMFKSSVILQETNVYEKKGESKKERQFQKIAEGRVLATESAKSDI